MSNVSLQALNTGTNLNPHGSSCRPSAVRAVGDEASPRSIADLVATVAQSNRDAVALRAGAAAMTYGELLTRADTLAQGLSSLGVTLDVPVGICVKRSFERIIAMLGVLRAGGAFLLLDPAWPEERLRMLLDDARAPVVIAMRDALEGVSAEDRLVVSARNTPRPKAVMVSRVAPEVGPDNLAYVIYTSGSTGRPKGVEITQGNLVNLVSWHQKAFAVTPEDRASHLAGLGFDASVWEVWPYLAVGAQLVLADDAVRASPDLLRRWLVEDRISIAFVPTPLAEPMITAEWPAETTLRFLLTGGDTLHAWPRPDLPFAVVNNYGPTECTVVATSGVVPPARVSGGLPPIGRPIEGTQIHILDDRGEPVPDGATGEIHIGGANVARGYRNNRQATAHNFISDRFRDVAGARLYRTGDLGSRLPDGQISFHGRIDEQLKIRGHRVEPDEIIARLNRYPKVAQSAVIGYGPAGDKRLAAYIVPASAEEPSAQELRDFLAAALPDHLIPSSFIRLAALPSTANGKLDKTALPEPTQANMLRDADFRAPGSVTEQRIAAIIAELLGAERIGADDNFFLLGGHSLLGSQLVLRARDAFGADLTLRDLFEARTVANLAARVEQLLTEKLAAMSEDEARRWMTQ